MRFATLLGRLEERRLDLVQRGRYRARDPLDLRGRLAAGATGRHDLCGRHVARPDLEPQRHALGFPLEVLRSRLEFRPAIELDSNPGLLEVISNTDSRS